MPISVFLITFNEEDRIGSTIDSLKWTDEQIVVDGGSRDRTCEICREKGAKVFHRTFDNFENQKNYALSKTNHEWVLSIDADEIISPLLAEEIRQVVKGTADLVGYRIKRQNYFLGKPLRFAGQGNEYLLRFFLKKRGKFVGIVHEEVHLEGPVGFLKNEIVHTSTETLPNYYKKLKLYTDLDAERLISENRVPPYLKAIAWPLFTWILNYLIRGGFLDGWNGFVYHGLSCYYGWLKNFKARALKSMNSKKLRVFEP